MRAWEWLLEFLENLFSTNKSGEPTTTLPITKQQTVFSLNPTTDGCGKWDVTGLVTISYPCLHGSLLFTLPHLTDNPVINIIRRHVIFKKTQKVIQTGFMPRKFKVGSDNREVSLKNHSMFLCQLLSSNWPSVFKRWLFAFCNST